MLQCMNEKSLNVLNEIMNIVNNINDFSSVSLNDSDSKNVSFLMKVLIKNKKISCCTLKLKNSKISSLKRFLRKCTSRISSTTSN